MSPYKCACDDHCRVPLCIGSLSNILESIVAADRGSEMHTANRDSKYHCTTHPFPEDTDPSLLEVKEHGKCDHAVSNCDDAGRDDVARGVNEGVVHCSQVANIMHSDDG